MLQHLVGGSWCKTTAAAYTTACHRLWNSNCRQPHAGTHYFPNKDKYEGEWAADTMAGEGQPHAVA